MENIQEQIRQLSQADFDSLVAWVIGAESDRRERESSAEAAQARVIQELVESGKIPGPEYVTLGEAFQGAVVPVWKDPEGDITRMFPNQAVVRVGDTMWLSMLAGRLNPSEPGVDGSWQDVTDEVRVANDPELNQPLVDDDPEYFVEPVEPMPAPENNPSPEEDVDSSSGIVLESGTEQ